MPSRTFPVGHAAKVRFEKFAAHFAKSRSQSACLQLGTARSGINIHSVPNMAELGIDIRTVAGQDHAQVLKCLCRVLGPQISLRTLLDVGSFYTEPTDVWMQRVFALRAARSGVAQQHRTVSYFTGAAALCLPLGMQPVVTLGPGEPEMAHQTDEYCRVERIGEAVLLYTDLIDDWSAK